MINFRDNFKHALRMFRANPGFTFAAIAALALGIGINTAIFTVVDTVLLKPLTYPDADRIVEFWNTSPNGQSPSASVPTFHTWEQQTNVFQDAAAFDTNGPGFDLTGARPGQLGEKRATRIRCDRRDRTGARPEAEAMKRKRGLGIGVRQCGIKCLGVRDHVALSRCGANVP